MLFPHKKIRRSKTGPGGKGIFADESGQAAVEYILLAGVLVVFFSFAVINYLHEPLQAFFSEISAYVSLPVP